MIPRDYVIIGRSVGVSFIDGGNCPIEKTESLDKTYTDFESVIFTREQFVEFCLRVSIIEREGMK